MSQAVGTQTSRASGANPPPTRAYWRAQAAFWGLYFLFNSVFIALFTVPLPLYFLITLTLSLLMCSGTHGLRALYKARRQKPMRAVLPHLIWLLPLLALTVQTVLFFSVRLAVWLFPALREGTQASTPAMFVAYTLNTMCVLGVWVILYLGVEQFRRRREAEIAHWRTLAQLRETELQFLRSQINSHFLFNALNNLRALIREDPEQARERLTQLAVLLRAILQAENREKIPLADELELVNGYLALESLQFEKRLHITQELESPLPRVDVPPLLLQTLVENAVRHGIARRPAGGELVLRVSQQADSVCVQIRNGLPQTPATEEGHGIGLKNARARLYKLFGERASLSLRPEGDVMVADLRLPLE